MGHLNIHPSDAFDLTKNHTGMFETANDDIEYHGHHLSKTGLNSEEESSKNISTLVSEVLHKLSNLPEEKKIEIITLCKKAIANNQKTLTTNRVTNIFLDLVDPAKTSKKAPEKESSSQQMKATQLKTENVVDNQFPQTASDSNKTGDELINKLDNRKLRKLDKQRLKEEKIAGAKNKKKKSGTNKNEHAVTHLKLDTNEKIRNMRYSQDSIAGKSTDGIDLYTVIKDKGWKTGVTMMGVEMPDGKYTSLDNRRLYALKRIVHEVASDVFKKAASKPTVHIYNHDHTSEKIQKEVKRLKNLSENLGRSQGPSLGESGLKEGTIGALVYYRMRGGGVNAFNQNNIHGFESNPLVRPSNARVD